MPERGRYKSFIRWSRDTNAGSDLASEQDFVQEIVNNQTFITNITTSEEFVTQIIENNEFVTQLVENNTYITNVNNIIEDNKDVPNGIPGLNSNAKLHPNKTEYISSILEEGGFDVDNIEEALNVFAQLMLDRGWIGSMLDRWVDEAGTVMENGTVLNNVTRMATAQDQVSPDGHYPFIFVSNSHQNPLWTITGLPEGLRVRVSAKAWAPSGGGTHMTIVVQSGNTILRNDTNPSIVTAVSQTVTIGANGQISMSCGWNPAFYDLTIESLGLE